ncbi:MAG: pglF 1 [Magnetococcales bacterium]|nr:pglF 1 [Magnetococcales bacterium]HIJ85877.1 polysaccharide biosynthesis protein [Magnetococcales bacterium]
MFRHSDFMARLLGRSQGLFQKDFEIFHGQLESRVSRCRILVVGAAGSIGSHFVKQLMALGPKGLCLVDPSENNLVELVRDLRSSDMVFPGDFSTVSIALGTPMFERFLASVIPFDVVVNFAALKHVRSERDPFSTMRMIKTNILDMAWWLDELERTPPQRFFSVSSDKAVQPASLMGASKAMMERLMFLASRTYPCSSARFANVAFSDGSLLHGFLRRLEKGQPLSAPNDIKRYFISHEEAGQLCLLACFLGGHREIFVPRLDQNLDLKSFADIAVLLLQDRGLEPELCRDEKQARAFARRRDPQDRRWPCCFTPSDTSGEKPYEEFFDAGETLDDTRFENIVVVKGPPVHEIRVREALTGLSALFDSPHWDVEGMAYCLGLAIPELQHLARGKNLDEKM